MKTDVFPAKLNKYYVLSTVFYKWINFWLFSTTVFIVIGLAVLTRDHVIKLKGQLH